MTEPKWYDLTLSKDMGWTVDNFNAIARIHCERWAVGNEVGEGGYQHLQARVVFKIGKEEGAVRNLFPGAHTSPSHERNFDYVMKEGDFYCSWEHALREYSQLELRKWQQAVLMDLEAQDDRQVTVIVDEMGGAGKTTFAKYLVATHKGYYCPELDTPLDYMAWALAHKGHADSRQCFVMDIPRCGTKQKDKAMWNAVEQMKNGYLYDKRNQWREEWILPPKMLIFTNEYPDFKFLSKDRWRIYELKPTPEHKDGWLWPVVVNKN